MKRSRVWSAVAGAAVAACGAGEVGEGQVLQELREPVLGEVSAGGPAALMLHRVLTARMAEAGAAIRAEQDALSTAEQLADWQRRTRAACLGALGGFPERTPLNVRVTGTVAKDGYRVEKLLFESRPAFYVTALLFLPDARRHPPPYPGILIPCGHSDAGKAFPGYQRGALLAAVNGMAALIYDPIDQGERLQGVGKGNVAGHNVTGVSAALLGLNTATFRIWDGLRALDYLASRPEVDARRLGCMGNSGGGTLTAYLSALDGRIAVSAPSCFISSVQHVCAAIGPQDAEQNLFGQLSFGLEHSGWLLLRATKPTAVCTATQDFFPIDGACQTVAEVTRVYGRLGAEERIRRVETQGPHGWAEPTKVEAVRWMSRWMRQTAEIEVPPETETGLPAQEAKVVEGGQVLALAGARSVYDLLSDEAERLAASRGLPEGDALRASVRRLAGLRELDALPVPVTRSGAPGAGEGYSVRRVALLQAGVVPIAAVLFTPDVPKGAPALVVDGLGKTNAAVTVAALLREGRSVLAADLCGFGETYGCAHAFYGAANRDEGPAVMAYLLGRSLVGLRAEDVLTCARWLSVACGGGPVELHAANWAVTPALHAAAAEPQLFGQVAWTEEPHAWEEVVAQRARHRFSDVVNGAMGSYTIRDLKAAVSGRKR
jgi:hypothetical protein